MFRLVGDGFTPRCLIHPFVSQSITIMYLSLIGSGGELVSMSGGLCNTLVLFEVCLSANNLYCSPIFCCVVLPNRSICDNIAIFRLPIYINSSAFIGSSITSSPQGLMLSRYTSSFAKTSICLSLMASPFVDVSSSTTSVSVRVN